jgi:ElaB/YqjD/DUF883 family membrane-anchored ribosome-binding protein
MGANPDQLTDQIAATRGRMTETADEVRTRVSPSQAVQRRVESAREAASEGGSAVADQARHAAQDTARTGRRVMHAAADTARERPLLTGVAAFGAGLLVGVLAPASDTERRAARRLQSDLEEPVREAVADSAHEVSDTVRDRVSEATEHVKDEAHHAVDEVRAEASDAADAARERAREASEAVRDDIERRT